MKLILESIGVGTVIFLGLTAIVVIWFAASRVGGGSGR